MIVLILYLCLCLVRGEKCPNGADIYERGITAQGKIDVLAAHNNYRLKIASGGVPGQPKGINLKKMKYDDILGKKGSVVSDTCKMEHVTVKDGRFKNVGQNLHISWSSSKTTKQDWDKAVTKWFDENKDFVYPDKSKGVTGHYTQVVWADSEFVGCDFIAYYDKNKPKTPYARLYTCNYGPGGNFKGMAPYETGKSGCANLC